MDRSIRFRSYRRHSRTPGASDHVATPSRRDRANYCHDQITRTDRGMSLREVADHAEFRRTRRRMLLGVIVHPEAVSLIEGDGSRVALEDPE